MEITDVSPVNSNNQVQNCQSIIDRFEQLWNNWYDDPTQRNGEKLLHFLKGHENYFERLAEGKPVPPGWPPNTPFSHYYEAAINSLEGWISHGCNPNGRTPVSEWISDVNIWIHEK